MTITPSLTLDTFDADYGFIIPVDLSPVDYENPHFCYTHYRHGFPLYIGIAKNWRKRTRQHAFQSPWFCAVDQIVVVCRPTEIEARTLEKRLVIDQEPLFNKDLFGGILPIDIFRQRLAKLYAHLDNPSQWQVENPYARPPHWDRNAGT